MLVCSRFGNRTHLISHVATSHRNCGYRGFPDTMRSQNGSPRYLHGAEGGDYWMQCCTAGDGIGQCCSACDASCQCCSACDDLSALSSLHPHGAEFDIRSLIKPLTLSSLEFQGEGLRHCVGLICTFGESFFHPTHGAGWRCDIAAALEATSCKFDTDPRVLRCIGLTDSAEHLITEDAFTSRRKMVKEDEFPGTLVASSRGPFESQSRGGRHNHHEATPAVSAAHRAEPYLCIYQSKQNAQSETLINMMTNSVASPACDGHASAAQPGSAGGASSSPAALLRLHHMKVGITMHGG